MAERPELLTRLADWLAAGPDPPLRRPRLLIVGDAGPGPTAVAELVRAGVVEVEPGEALGGISVVDAEVDSGADLLLLATPGADVLPATVAIAACAGAEPVKALGFDPDLDDAEWVRRVVELREGLRRVDLTADRDAVLSALGGAALATASGIVEQAARRRTPVVLDGLSPLAAAVLTSRAGSAIPARWLAAGAERSPAAVSALRLLGLEPVLDVGAHAGDGTAALLVLPLLRAAALG